MLTYKLFKIQSMFFQQLEKAFQMLTYSLFKTQSVVGQQQ
jgi:hypothetical protein